MWCNVLIMVPGWTTVVLRTMGCHFGVPRITRIRTIVFGGLYWDPPFYGSWEVATFFMS